MLKKGFPGSLKLNQCGPLKDPLFWNHSHGADLVFPLFQLQTKVNKRPLVSSHTHHALAVLVAFSTMMSQPLFNCFGGVVLFDTMGAAGITFFSSLSCECRRGSVSAKAVCVRMDVSGRPDSCDFFSSFFFLILLRKWNLGVEHYFLLYFPPFQIISLLCPLSLLVSFFLRFS